MANPNVSNLVDKGQVSLEGEKRQITTEIFGSLRILPAGITAGTYDVFDKSQIEGFGGIKPVDDIDVSRWLKSNNSINSGWEFLAQIVYSYFELTTQDRDKIAVLSARPSLELKLDDQVIYAGLLRATICESGGRQANDGTNTYTRFGQDSGMGGAFMIATLGAPSGVGIKKLKTINANIKFPVDTGAMPSTVEGRLYVALRGTLLKPIG